MIEGDTVKKLVYVLILLQGLVLAGCASVPLSSVEEDRQAKEFVTVSDKANIYLYRNERLGGAVAMPVALDGKVMGKTGPKTYFLWQVEPGKHEIASLTENTAKVTIDAQAGKNHFVWQEVKLGVWAPRSKLHEVDTAEGQKAVKECKRIKPGL